MKRFLIGLLVVAVIILAAFGGYGARWVVKEPSNITVETAMAQVAEGLKTLYAAKPTEGSYGLFPAELEINFSISAGGKDSSSLVVAPISAAEDVIGRASGQTGSNKEASRSNTIRIKFINLLYAPQDSLVRNKSGREISELLAGIQGHPWLIENEEAKQPDGTAKPVEPPKAPGPVPNRTSEDRSHRPTDDGRDTQIGDDSHQPVTQNPPKRKRPSVPEPIKFPQAPPKNPGIVILLKPEEVERVYSKMRATNSEFNKKFTDPATTTAEKEKQLSEFVKENPQLKSQVESFR